MAEDYTPVFRNRLETESNSRISQIGICFANAFHMFFQHRSWMVLPMTAVLSLIAGLAIREDFFETMEATMTGAFVLVGVCIWNGSFSSIQTICRERNVIREKFRLRLHSSSYTIANMLFQLLVCLTETGIMLVMLWAAGIRYTVPPLITPWFALDFGITLFLVIYASDMVALFVSALCRTKTAAMTILPFILVLQLVFSGSIISIPDSIDPIAMITVSRPGFKAMASQADLNKLPLGMVESILTEMEDVDLHAHITLGQVLELLGDSSNPAVAKARSIQLGGIRTIGELNDILLNDARFQGMRDTPIIGGLTVGILLTEINEAGLLDDFKDKEVGMQISLGDAVDMLTTNRQMSGFMDEGISVDTSVDEILSIVGKEKTQKMIEDKAAEKYYDPAFAHTTDNVMGDWIRLAALIVVFAFGTAVTLKLIGIWSRKRALQKK